MQIRWWLVGKHIRKNPTVKPGQLKVLSQQCEKSVKKPKSGLKSAGTEEHRIKKKDTLSKLNNTV